MSRYTKLLERKGVTPEQRKALYKYVQKEKKKEIIQEYTRPKRIIEDIKKFGERKIIYKKLFKEDKPGTIVFKKEEPRSKHFKEIMEKAKWI